jgi:hypothetical protein
MAIKFICTCGKHLRARDEMAARRAFCPRCGNPVGIPSLQPTHSGTPVHVLSPAERRRRRRVRPPDSNPLDLGPSAPADAPASAKVPEPADFADPGLVTLRSAEGAQPGAPTPGPHRVAAGIRQWGLRESLPWFFAGRALLLVLGLALALTAATGLVAFVLPEVLARQMESEGPWPFYLLAALPFAVLAYYFGFLECVFVSAAVDEVWLARWPGRDLHLVVRSTVRWLIAFLAGPIVPAAAGLFFWIYSGDLAVVDRLILMELAIATIAYWLLVVVALYEGDRLRSASPPKVVELVVRLGWRLPAAVVAMAALLVADGLLGLSALEEIPEAPVKGWLLLGGSWIGGLAGIMLLIHLLGRWCRRCWLGSGSSAR